MWVTVYSSPHIGNMRAYVLTDLIKRAFNFKWIQSFKCYQYYRCWTLTDDLDNGDDKIDIEAKKIIQLHMKFQKKKIL